MEVLNWIENTPQIFPLKTRLLNQLMCSQTIEDTEKNPQICEAFSYSKCRKSFSQDLHLSQSALKHIQKTPSFVKRDFKMYQFQYYFLPSSETSYMSHSSKHRTVHVNAWRWWGNPSFYRTDGCLLLPCTGLIGGQEDISLPVREEGTWRLICLFLSLSSTASGLADLLNHSGHHKKASGHGDHSCFVLVKHRLPSWEWKCFSLIEIFGFPIWVPLLNVKAWGKQRSHWCSSECLGGSRGWTAFALVKGRQRHNQLWRALNEKMVSLWLIELK